MLDMPWGHARFLFKSVGLFILILTGIDLLGHFSQDLSDACEKVKHTRGLLPAIFVLFMVLHLIVEAAMKMLRDDLESKRSSPETTRRKQPKGMRKQPKRARARH